MKLRRICETLPSSVCSARQPAGSSNTSATAALWASSGRSMPRRAPNRVATSNSRGRMTTLPASTLARSSRSLTSSDQVLGRLADEGDLLLLLARQFAVDPVQEDARQRQDRVQRRAELVAHVGQEVRLHLGRRGGGSRPSRPARRTGRRRRGWCPPARWLSCVSSLLARGAAPPAFAAVPGSAAAPRRTGPAAPARASSSAILRQVAPASAARLRAAGSCRAGRWCPPPGGESICEAVHQPPGADEPEPHARRRGVAAVQDGLQVLDARPMVADADQERGRRLVRRRGIRPSPRRRTGRRCGRSRKPPWRCASGPGPRSPADPAT